MDDLAEIWGILRPSSEAPTAAASVALDLEDSWRAVRGLPPIPSRVYLAVRGQSVYDMALWEVTVLDEKKDSKGYPVWVGRKTRLVWAGSKYKDPQSKDPHPQTIFNQATTYLDIATAVVWLQRYAQEHAEKAERDHRHLTEQANMILKSAESSAEEAKVAREFRLLPEDL